MFFQIIKPYVGFTFRETVIIIKNIKSFLIGFV